MSDNFVFASKKTSEGFLYSAVAIVLVICLPLFIYKIVLTNKRKRNLNSIESLVQNFFGTLQVTKSTQPSKSISKIKTNKILNWTIGIFFLIALIFTIVGIVAMVKSKVLEPNSPLGIDTTEIDGNDIVITTTVTQQSQQSQQSQKDSPFQSRVQKAPLNSIQESVTFTNIGTGIAIDKPSMKKWLNPSTANWTDGNGEPITLSDSQLRTQQGFIPPSFAYFPEGQNSQTYNPSNFKNGRQDCMKACVETDCTALQTEVPQNCYHEVIPVTDETGKIVPFTGEDEQGNPTPLEGEFTNSCGNNATHTCTLYYNNLSNADDAYFKLSTGELGVGNATKLGIKYYEESVQPDTTPSEGLPSTAPIKWCPSTVTEEPNDGSCVFRNLLTTEFVRNKIPFYNLPISVEKEAGTEASVCKAVNVDAEGNETCCGICVTPSGEKKLVSCATTKCESDSSTNCWHVDTQTCNGSLFDPNSQDAQDAMANFLEQNQSQTSYNFTPLMDSCYYRNEGCVSQKTQAKVDSKNNLKFCLGSNNIGVGVGDANRGCFGAPNIISVEESTDIGACSSNAVIPSAQRCVNNPPCDKDPSKCLCTEFPYGCGSQFGSNRLWIKKV